MLVELNDGEVGGHPRGWGRKTRSTGACTRRSAEERPRRSEPSRSAASCPPSFAPWASRRRRGAHANSGARRRPRGAAAQWVVGHGARDSVRPVAPPRRSAGSAARRSSSRRSPGRPGARRSRLTHPSRRAARRRRRAGREARQAARRRRRAPPRRAPRRGAPPPAAPATGACSSTWRRPSRSRRCAARPRPRSARTRPPFRPHVSLVYGELPAARRRELAADPRVLALAHDAWWADRLELWTVEGQTERWRCVEGVALERR